MILIFFLDVPVFIIWFAFFLRKNEILFDIQLKCLHI